MGKRFVWILLSLLCAAGLSMAQSQSSTRYAAKQADKGWRSRLRTNPVRIAKAGNPVKVAGSKAWAIQEGFEGSFPPAGWTTVDVAGSSFAWEQSSSSAHSGTYSALINYDCSGGTAEDWLITPPITIQNNDSIYFWMDTEDFGYAPDDTYLKISTTDSLLSSFTTTLWHIWEGGGYINSWTQYVIDLSAYAGQTVYLAFQHTDDCGDGIFIDDVSVGHEYTPTSHDVCVYSIDMPTSVVDPGIAFTPTATIQDPGLSPESDFKIFFQIIDSLGTQLYLDSTAIASPDSILPDSLRQFTFGDFIPAAYNRYTAVVWTGLVDDYSYNDTISMPFRTWDLDVAATAIESPTGSTNPDSNIVPRATFHNVATQTADFAANFEATYNGIVIYDQKLTVTGLASGADTTVEFPAWPGVRLEGGFKTIAYAEIAHDLNNANDTIAGSFGSSYNIWFTKTALSNSQYCQAVAPWNGRIYLFGGAPSGTFCNTIQYYDTLSEIWDTVGIALPHNLFGASAITYGDRIYIIGGCETWANPLTNVYCYWPDGDSLTTKASLPTATMEMAAGLWRDSLIYIMGGGNWDMAQINTVQVYDIANDSWSTGTAMPGAVGTNGGGVCGDTIVSIGGYLTDACYVGVIDPMDPTSISWSTGTPYPAGSLCRPSTAVRNHKLYTAAGYNGSDATANAYYYSPAEDSWTQLPDKTTATIGAGQAAMVGEWMYVIAGESTNQNEALWLGAPDNAKPVVTATSPADGGTGLHLKAPLEVTFSKAMDTATIFVSCNPDPGSWAKAWNADQTMLTLSHEPFEYATGYSASVDSGKSLDGYSLIAGVIPNPVSFTTWDPGTVIQDQMGTGSDVRLSQIFSDFPEYSSYMADDIDVTGLDSVKISTVEIVGGYWNGHTFHPIDSIYMCFTSDSSANNLPAWSQTTWENNILLDGYDEVGLGSSPSKFVIYLDPPVTLPVGKSWMIWAPYMNYAAKDGQCGWVPNPTIRGLECSWINPGGGFGVGTDWMHATAMFGTASDAFMKIYGQTFSGVAGKPGNAVNAVFALQAAHPNPVRGMASFNFSLPKDCEYSLKVYNITGQMVHCINSRGKAGNNAVSWNTGKTAAGVYLYNLSAAGRSATRKMVVIK